MQGELQPALEMMALYLQRSKSQPVFIDVDFIDLFSYYRPVLDLFEQFVSKARECKPPELISSSFLATHLEATMETTTAEFLHGLRGSEARCNDRPTVCRTRLQLSEQ